MGNFYKRRDFMKKISRRMLALVFVALMVVSLIPAKPVSAASMYYPKKVTTFESRGTSNSINISNLPKGVRLKSVKTSNSDVINITNIELYFNKQLSQFSKYNILYNHYKSHFLLLCIMGIIFCILYNNNFLLIK